MAVSQHQAGNLSEAERLYRDVLEIDPENADALHLLGVVASQTGRHDVAVGYIEHAIRIKPNDASFHSNLGIAYRSLNQLDDAVASYLRAIELHPDFDDAHYNLGISLKAQGRLRDAVASYRRCLEINPSSAKAHTNLGVALAELNQFDEAISAYQQALRIKPNHVDALVNLGKALKDQGKLDEAVANYQQALQINPNSAEAHCNLGVVFTVLGKFDEAVTSFQRALQLEPDMAKAHNNLGVTLKDQGKLDEALACFQRALLIKPACAETISNVGSALAAQGKLDEAVAKFERSVELAPESADALVNMGNALTGQGKLDEAITSCQRALDIKPDYAEAHSNLLLTRQYVPGVTLEGLAREHAEWNRRHAEPLKVDWKKRTGRFNADKRIRIGFVSPDLGCHPVGYFLISTFERLNAEDFASICYSDRAQADDLTLRFKTAASQWYDTAGMTNKSLAEKIRADEIDILFDLSGHTAGNRLLLFARKPAPIQVTWAGYVGTTGLEAMDFLMADRYHVPIHSEPHYQETVIRLPDAYVCYEPPAEAPPVASLPALSNGSVTFGSFNNPSKLNADVVAVWAEILRRVDCSRLLLKYRGFNDVSNRQRVENLFSSQDVDTQRIMLEGSSPRDELLASYSRVDVALDTFPYSGGLTTCESLWMGVPVVTCPGETFAGRHSLSHLSNVGLPQTVCTSHDGYIQCAVELGNDLPELAHVRSGLRDKMANSPLCDAESFTRSFETECRRIWMKLCQS